MSYGLIVQPPAPSGCTSRLHLPACRLLLSAALLFLAQAFSGPDASGQATGAVEGVVRSAEGEPLPGATVQLAGTRFGDVADAGGRFALNDVPAGLYDITAGFIGFETGRQQVAVEAGEAATVTFELDVRALVLDDLVVTAQKRVQEIQEVPVAVTAYGGAFLDERGIQEFDALSTYVPGLEVQIQSVNNPGFVIRGITSDDGDARVEPRVSVFQDGVSISKSRGSVVELFDVERVEVLKGPQGTLFGRGAQIGAVHVIQNKALDERSGEVSIGAGNFEERYLSGYVNAPILPDRLFGRVAALYNRRDGFVDNVAGDDLNGKETFALRTALRALPTDRTLVDVIFNFQQDTPPGTSFKSGVFAPSGGLCEPLATEGCAPQDDAALGPDAVLLDDDLFIDRTVWGVTALVDHTLRSAWTLGSITAYRAFDSLERFDADGTIAPALQFDEDAEGRQFSQELRLTYNPQRRFSGFGGASLFYEDGSQRVPFRTDERSFAALVSAQIPIIPDVPLIGLDGQPVLIEAFPNPVTGELVPLKPEQAEAFTNFGETLALEAFVDGTASMTDRLDVTAGLRFTFEDVTGAYETTSSETPSVLGFFLDSAFGAFPNLLVVPADGRQEVSETFTSLVGRLAVDYELAPETNVFATVARGRRPNVLNVTATTVDVLDDEIVWSYEAGVKGLALESRLAYSANAFLYDYSNFQTNIADLEDGGLEAAFRPEDSGEATAFGFEAAVRAALLRGVSAFANYGYVDAEFDEEDSEGNPQELAGNRFRLTPEHKFALGADLSAPVGRRAVVFFRPSFAWKSEVFFEEDNQEAIRQDAYGLLDLRGGIRLPDERLAVEAFVENALDQAYIIDAGNTGGAFGIPTFIAGPPRLWGLRLTGRF